MKLYATVVENIIVAVVTRSLLVRKRNLEKNADTYTVHVYEGESPLVRLQQISQQVTTLRGRLTGVSTDLLSTIKDTTATPPKLELYKTAYSPMYSEYVKIMRVRYDTECVAVIHALTSDGEVMFREHELTKYCL